MSIVVVKIVTEEEREEKGFECIPKTPLWECKKTAELF